MAVICPMAWLWRGADVTFIFKLSLLQLEAVGIQGPRHSQGGPSLVLRGGCTPQPQQLHTSHATSLSQSTPCTELGLVARNPFPVAV